ncbi:MAG: hypothetical protein EOO16_17990 [Chitinophagaceae bacterium]|nr:MAG: hypothetical protein EOO16_17990 [Chitinophagaceae bacterium]
MDLKSALENLTVYGPNPTDLCIFNLIVDLDDSGAVEAVLRDWASRFGHTLRPPGGRNPFARLSAGEVAGHISSRLSRDIVFNTRGFEEPDSRAMADALMRSFAIKEGIATDFVISDWTYCELLVCTGETFTVVIASLGED